MRTKTNEIFLVRDYDNGEITDYYLTDDANGCCCALEDIDTITDDDCEEDLEENYPSLVEELGKRKVRNLVNLKCINGWVDAFERLCKYRGIIVKQVNNLECYDY